MLLLALGELSTEPVDKFVDEMEMKSGEGLEYCIFVKLTNF